MQVREIIKKNGYIENFESRKAGWYGRLHEDGLEYLVYSDFKKAEDGSTVSLQGEFVDETFHLGAVFVYDTDEDAPIIVDLRKLDWGKNAEHRSRDKDFSFWWMLFNLSLSTTLHIMWDRLRGESLDHTTFVNRSVP